MPTQTTPEKIFIGVSWPYASGNIHLGHVMGQYTVCDIFARYHRLKGNKVLMVSGSDCHGAPIVFGAEEKKITPEELINKSHKEIVNTYKKLGFIYENYTSTHTENHTIVVQNIFKALHEFGYLKIEKSQQYYDTKVERFLPDRYVRGTCPKCNATNARGDECPECGEFLSPEDLINPYSTLSDSVPVMRETEHFYMDLSKTKDELLDFLKDKDYWRDWVKEFSKGFIKEGLKPRAVTRDLNFGIPVPFDGWDGKVVYVWIEAVVGYLSAAIEWSDVQSKKGNTAPNEWEDFWKSKECKHYYFIAGGNAPFHTIMWPAELIAYNNKYKSKDSFEKYKLPNETSQTPLNLPFDVPANKILLYQGRKMSKGDHSNIPLDDLLEMFSPDLMRYFTTRFAPENHDRDFVWKDIIDLNNNELVANIGNFINRTVSFTNSKFEGAVPSGNLTPEVKSAIEKVFVDVANHLEHTEFVHAVDDLLEFGHFANKYFNDEAPWTSIKDQSTKQKAENTLFNCLQIVAAFRVLLKPFLPFAASKIDDLIQTFDSYDPNKELEETGFVSKNIDQWQFVELPIGHKIGETKILFEKLEYSKKLEEMDTSKPDSTNSISADTIEFTQSEALKSIPVITSTIQNIKVKKLDPKVNTWVEEQESEIKRTFANDNWQESPLFTGYTDLHNKYSNELSFATASENLVELLKTKGALPKVNNVVDIYNAISAKYGITIGVHDIAKLEGQPKLTILEKDMDYQTIGGKIKDTAKTGEYAYTDDKGIICRMDVKQCDRTKVSEKTKDLFIILQGHDNLGEAVLKQAMAELLDVYKELALEK
jgi:methionyl-tRNA synthetase